MVLKNCCGKNGFCSFCTSEKACVFGKKHGKFGRDKLCAVKKQFFGDKTVLIVSA